MACDVEAAPLTSVTAMSRPLLLAIPLLFLIGCKAVTLPGEDLEPVAGIESNSPEALAEARGRWADAGLSSYQYQIEYSCFCPPEAMGPFTVTVRDGAVASSVPSSQARPSLPTVEDLFAKIAEAYVQEAATVDVTYDPDLGYPLSIFIDYDEQMADEEFRASTSGLEPLGN